MKEKEERDKKEEKEEVKRNVRRWQIKMRAGLGKEVRNQRKSKQEKTKRKRFDREKDKESKNKNKGRGEKEKRIKGDVEMIKKKECESVREKIKR